ncbi:bifunctional proline dehydrogenase/L-glutamate gamma-semialdehyde dehydrogenase PutA [Thalassomonas sp. M1454]|uniref:bifunctional proline dehydrogenase/L-glutamate gamma-semialdehyde dehydrogenase PutA n=1 Tax=Thalassomonas sp. M1454 TaxID=2594477 RepID=UPI0011810D89|nr:bifunctional proline dehydrogenase/L-glutamate gamma-semialdehyde dehydrogenase PutA [Thalassomonas sp. M1454]TRX55874.1 bifunctional proline dehydrogenase/L-glutamate gamma-semialdehyde dehydrogenase PutA [Thalassomonas sp. M1454]
MLFNGNLITNDPIRQQIRDHYRADENEVLNNLIPLAEIGANARSRAWERARQMVVQIRKDQTGKGGVDALLNEFSLSSEEGVVLMCLAEALLRVPDKLTADNLIRDKLAEGDWSSHLGNSDSIFVNASSWGLLFTGKLVNYTDENKKQQFGLLKKTIGRLGEPVIRKAVRYAMKIMGTQFVMGHTIDSAVERAVDTEAKGYTYSYDMLGEGARTMADADRYFDSYVKAIDVIGKAAKGRGPQKSPGISIKLSAIHPRYEFTHRERVIAELIPRLKHLALAAKSYNIGFTVDAEEADRLDISLDVIGAVFLDEDLAGWDGFGIALQAYQKRALYVVEWVREQTLKAGRQMMVRLVKGAYWDAEIKISQVEGYNDFPVFSRKPSTDVSYHACAKKLLSYRDSIYPQFATHNAYTVATILEMTDDYEGFEFQRLHGMGESLYDQVVVNDNVPCRVYAPVGHHEDLLAYLVRRLLENGANSSFVNNIVDENIPVESLLTDPVELVQSWQNKYNPQIPQSIEMFGSERANSKGLDLTTIDQITPMRDNLNAWFEKATATQAVADAEAVINPANHNEVIGYIKHADSKAMQNILASAHTAFTQWSQTDVNVRAELLLKTADALEANQDELIALCIKEAGKIPADGVAEVREAVDFCRYYAARAPELMADKNLQSRGVVLCISPWNFPLAIFLGQVAAAIVTGNTVVAKPAEQTSLIALRTIELMTECGLPEGVVVPVIARGSEVGAHIVPDERIQAVMFTGSTETGTWISQKLAERQGEQVPLIAETGGQNCMIVDSTALPEQVVDDVVTSGFQSAGQRCSALRVLFVQEDVADKVISMIKGAMAELHVGDPAFLSTDVGPVIDNKAFTALNDHVSYLEGKSTLHYQCKLPEMGDTGNYFFAPRLYEISDLSVLKKEVFGPCVHVIRFKAADIENVIEQINGTGFGLTMGIHTRIEEKSEYLSKRSRAGNVYVNRNMIGAVVGVQPFGGRGLSGTGPKAGGPMYLTRLVKEINTSAENTLTSEQKDLLQAQFNEHAADAWKIGAKLQSAKNDELNWRDTAVGVRVSIVRQLLAKIADHKLFISQESELESALIAARQQLSVIEKALANPTTLPGPTGESNKLYLESRGILASIGDSDTSFEFWLVAIASALASGNPVIALVNEEFLDEAIACEEVLAQLGLVPGIFQAVSLNFLPSVLEHDYISGAIVENNSALKQWIGELLAARTGAILPVLTAQSHQALFKRLVTEKTVTIDTTAAGGNASLMTMELTD